MPGKWVWNNGRAAIHTLAHPIRRNRDKTATAFPTRTITPSVWRNGRGMMASGDRACQRTRSAGKMCERRLPSNMRRRAAETYYSSNRNDCCPATNVDVATFAPLMDT